jgi:hypothetical protein
MLKRLFLLILASIPLSAGAVSVRYSLVANFDGSYSTAYPIGNKPDEGSETLPDGWSRVTIDPGVLTFDSASNRVEYDTGVFTLETVGGQIWGDGDYVDGPGITIASANDFSIKWRLASVTSTDLGSGNLDKQGGLLRASTANGAQMFYPSRIEGGSRLTYRDTTDGNAANFSPNPHQSDQGSPQWWWPQCDRATDLCRVYFATGASDPGSDPNTNWSFLGEFTLDWITSGDLTFVLAATPNDTNDEGDSILATFDNVTVDTSALDFAPGEVVFQDLTYSVAEDDGTVTLTAVRSGTGAGACEVGLSVDGGTAVPGTDFTTPSGTFTWADGVTGTDTVAITILDRAGLQSSRTIILSLSEVDCPSTVDSQAATVTISDTDGTTFAADTPSYTSVIPTVACFGCDITTGWDESWSVYHVTSLGTGNGAGTYRAAVGDGTTWSGCRAVVFDISGTISYSPGTRITYDNSCLHVMGASAPSPGIIIAGVNNFFTADDVMFSDMTFAQKDFSNKSQINSIGDACRILNSDGVIFYRSICMFGSDENIDIENSSNVNFIHSASAWGLCVHGHPSYPAGTCHSMGFLAGVPVTNVLVARSVFAFNHQRNPLFGDTGTNGGTWANNIIYEWGSGSNAGHTINSTLTLNMEGNLYRKSSSQAAFRIFSSANSATRVFWDSTGDGMNRGLGSISDPPSFTNSGIAANQASSRQTGSYPAGLSITNVGTNTSEETAFLQLHLSCDGPRPSDRYALLDTFYGHVENGTGSIIDNVSDVGGIPTLTQNSVDHDDLPADPNAVGSVGHNALWDWWIGKANGVAPSWCAIN